MTPVSVLLVDDHALIRQGLRRSFEHSEDLEVVAEAGSLSEAQAMVRAHTPQVAVIDVNLGDGNGIDLVRQLRADHPEMGLVVLTVYDGDEHMFGALDAGASAFVLKSAPAEEVAAAVRQSARSPTSFAASGMADAMRRRLQGNVVQLTPRESEILQLLAAGMSVAQVAQELYISQSTAKTHMSKLYSKLDATNRTQAVMTAVRLGLVASQRQSF